ncbi:uncharacterized protein LOC135934584 isoform X2 [Cloeon dipterum]|uniref:uncharacterized protein LOC135934584 isoform X2 n=1 Tax=Cloeon dipterum TaxID=197152 RepID=UPI0032208E9C
MPRPKEAAVLGKDKRLQISTAMKIETNRSLLEQLLHEIYRDVPALSSPSEGSIEPFWDFVPIFETGLNSMRTRAEALRAQVKSLGSHLGRQLRIRDTLRRKCDLQCEVVTALLRAYSASRGEDARVRFSVVPPPSDSGFVQWRDAMKMVARMPGGIPAEFRRRLWLTLAERHLTARGVDWPQTERVIFSDTSNPDDEELGVQIVKDLHRTGCSLFCGASGEHNQALLKRVLLAYARWNKNVGYCQGFNMLAALILQVMDKSEADSVKVMILLIEGVLPDGYFASNMCGLSVDMAVFRELLRLRLPRLSRHLEALQAEASGAGYEPPLTNVFTMQWFLTLFANCLPHNTVLRLWDLVLLEGNEILLRAALAIWSSLQERILAVESADEFYSIMGVLTREMLEFGLSDANQLIMAVIAVKPVTELADLRDKFTYNITPWGGAVGAARRGLRLLQLDDDTDEDMDDDKMAVAAFGLGSMFGGRRASVDRERLNLDISALKQQYSRLRVRQRQAHIIISGRTALRDGPRRSSSAALTQLHTPQKSIKQVPKRKSLGATGTTIRWHEMKTGRSPSPPEGERSSSSTSTASSSTELCDSDESDNDDVSPLPSLSLPKPEETEVPDAPEVAPVASLDLSEVFDEKPSKDDTSEEKRLDSEGPQISEAPEDRSRISEAPEGRPQISKAPEDRPQISEAPEDRPQISEAPEGRPQISEAPEDRQQISEAPEGRPQISKAPEGRPQISEAPEERNRISEAHEDRPDTLEVIPPMSSVLSPMDSPFELMPLSPVPPELPPVISPVKSSIKCSTEVLAKLGSPLNSLSPLKESSHIETSNAPQSLQSDILMSLLTSDQAEGTNNSVDLIDYLTSITPPEKYSCSPNADNQQTLLSPNPPSQSDSSSSDYSFPFEFMQKITIPVLSPREMTPTQPLPTSPEFQAIDFAFTDKVENEAIDNSQKACTSSISLTTEIGLEDNINDEKIETTSVHDLVCDAEQGVIPPVTRKLLNFKFPSLSFDDDEEAEETTKDGGDLVETTEALLVNLTDIPTEHRSNETDFQNLDESEEPEKNSNVIQEIENSSPKAPSTDNLTLLLVDVTCPDAPAPQLTIEPLVTGSIENPSVQLCTEFQSIVESPSEATSVKPLQPSDSISNMPDLLQSTATADLSPINSMLEPVTPPKAISPLSPLLDASSTRKRWTVALCEATEQEEEELEATSGEDGDAAQRRERAFQVIRENSEILQRIVQQPPARAAGWGRAMSEDRPYSPFPKARQPNRDAGIRLGLYKQPK